MDVYFDLTQESGSDTAVALGMFDGVHLGHKQVIMTAAAHQENLRVAVLTFLARSDRPDKKAYQKDILTAESRIDRLAKLPVQAVYMPKFEQIRKMEAEEFVNQVLCDILHAKIICCGEDYRFGRNASGDVSLLTELAAQIGARVEVVPPYLDHGKPVSSTRIRLCLAEGDIDTVNRLLGYCYFISGKVIYGRQLGRQLGCPTINQELDSFICLPRFGVYISSTEIDGIAYPSITNIGIKPTIEGERQPLAETHIIGIERDLYGCKLKVKLHQFIRGEKKFDSLEQLSGRMHHDINEAKNFFQGNSAV
ncbi:bifunctional riboflavin kinase/FAD synthetase [Massiliimalia massiliensis]|uniref:bifunctional riboflavin kinase/FAD synthetase n=1 Tax=Massiliimalia massiliensis TaxID=1852384 RepID=UPI0009868650|nr:bifunctional riboflavin kinase/FAD synthetase [Massiliimalia massiliensis]